MLQVAVVPRDLRRHDTAGIENVESPGPRVGPWLNGEAE